MCNNHHLLPDEDGTPPWRQERLRGYLIFLAAFAAIDVALVAIVALR